MSRYIVLDDDDATKAGGPAAPTADSYNDFGWTVYRQDQDGHLLEVIGSDGGEPEDQLLVRNWSWVAPALESESDLQWRRMVVGPEPSQVVPCCVVCDTGRWVNTKTMRCAVDADHEVFDTRTSLPIPARPKPQ